MLRLLPFLFLTGLAIELATIILAGNLLGMIATLLLLAAGGLLGARLIMSAGTRAVAALRSPIRNPSLDKGLAGKTAARAVAGLFFLIPGFFSDLIGLGLLLPPVWRWWQSRLPIHQTSMGGEPVRVGTIIEAEATEIFCESRQPQWPPPRGTHGTEGG